MLRLPNETVEHPYQAEGPANGGVAAQAAPVEKQIGTDFFTSYYGCKDDEDRGACIVCEL